jgi:hypothetical protein
MPINLNSAVLAGETRQRLCLALVNCISSILPPGNRRGCDWSMRRRKYLLSLPATLICGQLTRRPAVQARGFVSIHAQFRKVHFRETRPPEPTRLRGNGGYGGCHSCMGMGSQSYHRRAGDDSQGQHQHQKNRGDRVFSKWQGCSGGRCL